MDSGVQFFAYEQSGAKWTEYWFHSRTNKDIYLTLLEYQKLFVYSPEIYTP